MLTGVVVLPAVFVLQDREAKYAHSLSKQIEPCQDNSCHPRDLKISHSINKNQTTFKQPPGLLKKLCWRSQYKRLKKIARRVCLGFFAKQKANGKPARADLFFVRSRRKMSTNNYYIVMGGYISLGMNER